MSVSIVVLFACLLFILAVGALSVVGLALVEQRKLAETSMKVVKANNLQEVTKAETEMKKAEVDLEQLKDAWTKEMAATSDIPRVKPKIVRDVNGKKFDMNDLEAL